jgi:hypothetical protein
VAGAAAAAVAAAGDAPSGARRTIQKATPPVTSSVTMTVTPTSLAIGRCHNAGFARMREAVFDTAAMLGASCRVAGGACVGAYASLPRLDGITSQIGARVCAISRAV